MSLNAEVSQNQNFLDFYTFNFPQKELKGYILFEHFGKAENFERDPNEKK